MSQIISGNTLTEKIIKPFDELSVILAHGKLLQLGNQDASYTDIVIRAGTLVGILLNYSRKKSYLKFSATELT